jgi:hypothetical protein
MNASGRYLNSRADGIIDLGPRWKQKAANARQAPRRSPDDAVEGRGLTSMERYGTTYQFLAGNDDPNAILNARSLADSPEPWKQESNRYARMKGAWWVHYPPESKEPDSKHTAAIVGIGLSIMAMRAM